jgi:hypothetical protein
MPLKSIGGVSSVMTRFAASIAMPSEDAGLSTHANSSRESVSTASRLRNAFVRRICATLFDMRSPA